MTVLVAWMNFYETVDSFTGWFQLCCAVYPQKGSFQFCYEFRIFRMLGRFLGPSSPSFVREKTLSKLSVLILGKGVGRYYLSLVISAGTFQQRQFFCRRKFCRMKGADFAYHRLIAAKQLWNVNIRSSFFYHLSPFFDCFQLTSTSNRKSFLFA